WIADPLKKEEIINHLNSLDGGHVLTDSEKEKYRIRYPHNYFGDIIYVIDDHYLIHPSFYGAGEYYPKGMHGYLPGCRDNESAFVLHGKRVIGKGDHGRIDMRKIFPTILDLLEIDYGNEMPHNLKSIIK
ncbi:MAG: hypothetical protein OEW87_14255, partial [Flavobacteriaceae bacterium]|nr:hypothetical protein [Flavobacteriaceae bacterium]